MIPFAFPRLTLLYLGVAALVVILVLVLKRLRASDPDRIMRQRMAEDATNPYKQWVQSAFLLVTRDCDYAYIPPAEARHLMQDWWDVRSANEFRSVLGRLRSAERADNAWDLVRFIVVARLGVAAGHCTDDESWRQIRPVARRLQQAYPSWAAMAQAYVQARRQWRSMPLDGSGDDTMMRWVVENIASLRDDRWRVQDFDADFEENAP